MSATGAEDYEHWPDDSSLYEISTVAASGYDSYNGLRSHMYNPAADVEKKEATPEPPKAQPVTYVCASAPQPASQPPQKLQYVTYPQMHYGYPQMAYPAPAYYGFPYPGQAAPQGFPGYGYPVCQPVAAAVEEKKKAPELKAWQGRTKAEVQEDNMKIAASEGVYNARKVEPKGLKEDQMVWCVETDGSHTLR